MKARTLICSAARRWSLVLDPTAYRANARDPGCAVPALVRGPTGSGTYYGIVRHGYMVTEPLPAPVLRWLRSPRIAAEVAATHAYGATRWGG